MANLISVEEAAKILGIAPADLNDLRQKGEIYGVRDGADWKFKDDEIERYKADRESGASSVSFDLPDMGGNMESDVVLVSEEELGGGPGASSTIIGGKPSPPSMESDLDLGGSDKGSGTGSDVTLVPDSGTGSDVKLVASDSPLDKKEGGSGGSDLDLVDLDGGDDLLLADDDLSSKSGPKSDAGDSVTSSVAEETLDISLDSDLSLGGDDDDLALASDDAEETLSLADDSSKGSALDLGGEFDDDDIVLGGSSGVGSDIADSGIDLGSAIDSGLSLEEPVGLDEDMSLGEDDEDGGEDDAFLLTPTLELDDESSDASGSQVIALDSEDEMGGDFDESAATMLGEDIPGMASMLEEDVTAGAAQPVSPIGAPSMQSQAPAIPEAQYGVGSILSLTFLFLLTSLTGIMMYDMMQNMWSWDQPYTVSSGIMDNIIKMFEN